MRIDQTVRNVVTTSSPGGRLRGTADCTTEHFTPHYLVSKSSDPPTGSTVNPGDTITYTLTVHNDSDATVAGAVVTDDLSEVLNNATVTVGAGATITGTTLTWNVPTILAAGGADATLTYTATVNAGAYNKTLTNVVTPGPGGDCISAADCTTDHFTPHYVLSEDLGPGARVHGPAGQ